MISCIICLIKTICMKSKTLSLALLIFGCVVIHYSCRKPNSVSLPASFSDKEARFFKASYAEDPIVTSIRSKVLKQNTEKHFVNKMVGYSGYPLWDQAKVIKDGTMNRGLADSDADKIIYVPFSLDYYDMIGAILIASIKKA